MSLTSQQAIQITPWQDRQELDDTFSHLLTATALHHGDGEVNVNVEMLHDAIQRVAVWRARGKMAHSVEIGGSLAELLLQDFISISSSSGVYPRYDVS